MTMRERILEATPPRLSEFLTKLALAIGALLR